jgi:hypothetical protein
MYTERKFVYICGMFNNQKPNIMNKVFAMVQTKSNFRNLNGRILEVAEMFKTRVTCKVEIDGQMIHVDFNLNEITELYSTDKANNNVTTESTDSIQCVELYQSPIRERNLDKYGHDTDQCICCGKPMKSGESLHVHMGTDWMAYNTKETNNVDGIEYISGTEKETQGFFRIGNDCAKKMKGFTFQITE